MTLGTRLSSQRSGAEAAFQCGQRNSLKTINVDGEHFSQFRGKSCVFKFIRLSVDVALELLFSFLLVASFILHLYIVQLLFCSLKVNPFQKTRLESSILKPGQDFSFKGIVINTSINAPGTYPISLVDKF